MLNVSPATVGIYLRISKDIDGTQTATERQEQDCHAWCARNGYADTRVYEDVDTSAFKRTVRRPAFERMIQDVRDGRLCGVIAWKIDRIARRQRDFVRLDDLCEEHGVWIATIADGIDTRTPMGRTAAEMFVSMARQESENISLRLKRRNDALAQEGKPHAGGRRHYGYTQNNEAVVPEEAANIREAARRILDGESLLQICRDWNARGITTAGGHRWATNKISDMFRRPTIVGKRHHNGQVTKERGWEPIISDDDFEAVGAILANSIHRPRAPRMKHLLTSILRCGRCGSGLYGNQSRRGIYICPSPSLGLGRGCGRLTRAMQPIDEAVRAIWIEAVSSPRLFEQIANAAARPTVESPDLFEQVRRDEAALERLAVDHYSENRISAAEYFAARDAIAARVERIRQQIVDAAADAPTRRILVTGPGAVTELWDNSTTEDKRALLLAIVNHITVLPAGKGQPFDVSQLAPSWRY